MHDNKLARLLAYITETAETLPPVVLRGPARVVVQ